MTIPISIPFMLVAVSRVGASFWLKGRLHSYKTGSEALQQVFDYVVGSNAKSVASNLRRQVPIAKMPGQTHELIGIDMPDFDNDLRGGLDLEPPSVLELQAISVGHRNRFREIEKNIFTLIPSQTNAPAMTRVEIEGETTCSLFFRPVPGRSMSGSTINCGAASSHIST
jgi:hypothetical protein